MRLVERITTAVEDYRHVSKTMVGAAAAPPGCPRVKISMAELRSNRDDGHLSRQMRYDPLRHLRALEAACHEIASEELPGYDKDGTLRPSC